MPPFMVLLFQYKRYFRRPTWLSFSICATKRGKRWTSVESFSVLTCLTIDRSSTSPSYAIGKIEVSLTEVWHRADITAARSRLLDVLKFASWISFKNKNMYPTKEILYQYNPKGEHPLKSYQNFLALYHCTCLIKGYYINTTFV